MIKIYIKNISNIEILKNKLTNNSFSLIDKLKKYFDIVCARKNEPRLYFACK